MPLLSLLLSLLPTLLRHASPQRRCCHFRRYAMPYRFHFMLPAPPRRHYCLCHLFSISCPPFRQRHYFLAFATLYAFIFATLLRHFDAYFADFLIIISPPPLRFRRHFRFSPFRRHSLPFRQRRPLPIIFADAASCAAIDAAISIFDAASLLFAAAIFAIFDFAPFIFAFADYFAIDIHFAIADGF